MRKTLNLLESIEGKPDGELVNEFVEPEIDARSLLSELADLSSRLREYMSPESGDAAFGEELGMQRAADMLDRVLRRYEGERH